MKKISSLTNRTICWLFFDGSGRIVLFQTPNVPLVLAILSYLVRSFSHGTVAHAADTVFVGMIFVWAWLEITDGVNGFRRILGVVVLVLVIAE